MRAVGLAVVELGGGRARAADAIDPAVGLTRARRRSARRSAPSGRWRIVHARDAGVGRSAPSRGCARAYRLGDAPPAPRRRGHRADRRGESVSILLAVTGLGRRRRGARDSPRCCRAMRSSTLGEPFDRDSVRYVAVLAPSAWRARRICRTCSMFSLGAGVDHLFADPALPEAPIVRVVDPDLPTG